MKFKLLIAVLCAGLFSCTKTPPSGDLNNTTGYECYCWWPTSPGHDTDSKTTYPSSYGLQKSTDLCATKDKGVKGMSGASSGAYCRIH